MHKQFVIFSLEPIETRYTAQWFTHLPKIFQEKLGDGWDVIQIDGKTISGQTTRGAFLDFLSTNQWKNEQTNRFIELVKDGEIRTDAVILFTDFWNPTINELRYIKDLLCMEWKFISFVHAGSYDPQDFLGRMIVDKNWVEAAEESFFEAVDINVFATEFHIDLFRETFPNVSKKFLRSGFPMEYISDDIYVGEKENLILFPHRLAPEKQVHIFDTLAAILPDYKFVVCQREKLSKAEYHDLLARAKVVFSASLQETLGISVCAEAICAGALPYAPDHLSYSEILPTKFLYPSEWITNADPDYIQLALDLKRHIECYDSLAEYMRRQKDRIMAEYFSCDNLIEFVKTKLN